MKQSRTLKAGILASGQTLTACANVIIFAVLSHILTVHEYATYRQTILAYYFAAPLLMLGLPHALYYFLPGEKNRARGVLLENLLLLSLMGAIFSLFLLLGGNRLLAWRFSNPDLEKTLLILAPYPLFMLPAAALTACLMARDRVKQVAFFNVFSRLVVLTIVLAASIVWRTSIAAIVATVVGAAVVLFPGLSLMLQSTEGSEIRVTAWGMWSQMKYSVPLGLATMLGVIAYSLDKIVVSAMCTPEQFAIYANGAIEIPLIGIVTGSVTAVLLPDLSRLCKQGEHAEALMLWKRSAKKCALVIMPAMCVLFWMAPEIVSVLFSQKYAASSVPFRFYLGILPVRVATFGVMIMAVGKTQWLLWRSVGDLVINLFLSILLVHFLGYIGAVVASIVTLYFWSVPFSLVVIAKEYETRVTKVFPYIDLAKIFAVSALACVVVLPNLFVENVSSLVRLFISVPVYAVFVCLLFFTLRFLDWQLLTNGIYRYVRSE